MKLLNYIFNKNNKNKKLYYNIKKIKGVNLSSAKNLLSKLGIQKNSTFNELNLEYKNKIYNLIATFIKENKILQLKNIEAQFIINKKNKKNYQGLRHTNNLPVRGQRTKTNANTKKNKKINKKWKK